VFRDHRQFISFVALNAVLILVAVIAQWWWFVGFVLLMMASGLVYRFGYWRRHRRSGVIP
jgi:1,4-dihydroxy-2-naphthoate octaprenyltransferase